MKSTKARTTGTAFALLTALIVMTGLSACQPVTPDTYVAMGDSYAAGSLIAPQFVDAGVCARSGNNYAHDAVGRLHVARLVDVTCSGATTWAFDGRQSLTGGGSMPPQLNALDARTKVVSLTIGGNDIGFSNIVLSCADKAVLFQTCQGTLQHDGIDTITNKINAFGPRLDIIFAAIKARAPKAQVYVVPYLPVFSSSPSWCAYVPLWGNDPSYLRAKTDELNTKIRNRTLAAGFHYVDGVANASGHDACQAPGTKWVEGVVPTAGAAPLHPNATGHEAMANRFVAAVTAANP